MKKEIYVKVDILMQKKPFIKLSLYDQWKIRDRIASGKIKTEEQFIDQVKQNN